MTPQGTDEQVTIRGVSGFHESLYTPGDGVSVELEPTYYRIRYDGTIGIRELKPREEMKFTCRVLDQVPDTAEPGLPPYFADFQQLYIERGPLTSRERDFVKQATLNSITPMARAQALEKAIGKQCKYNLEASKIADDEKLTDTFMFKNREGYCDLYATTMAEYARELGFATRVVSGYLVQEERTDSEGFISVSDDDAHMWAEIYFADVGWVPFDPTKYAEDITKSHGTGISWSKAGIALAVVALVSMIIFIVVHWIRDAKKGTSVFKEKNPAERVYASFQKVIASHAKVPRRLSETPVEYLTRVESTLGNHASVATEINQRLESEMFSRASNNEALAVIQSDVKQLKKLLRQR
jgi:transglutaminase-like putative cysteine protease